MLKTCNYCHKAFKQRVMIDGKYHNLQTRKYCLECSPFKQHNTRPLENVIKHKNGKKKCPRCQETKEFSMFYCYQNKKDPSKNRIGSYCKACNIKLTMIKQKRLKKNSIDYLGGKCSICNYAKCEAALEFHHKDPSKKDFSISHRAHISFEKAKKELDKCLLVCANCHREIHYYESPQ